MKKVLLFLLFSAGSLQSETLKSETETLMSLGIQAYHLKIEVGKLNTYTGPMVGGVASFERKKRNGLFFALDGSFGLGELSGQGERTRNVKEIEIEALIGQYAACKKQDGFTFTPFFGYGYDYSQQTLSAPAMPTVEFTYRKYYIPLGINMNCAVNKHCEVGLFFKWMPYFDRTMKIDVTPGTRWELEFTDGFFLSLPITCKFNCGPCLDGAIRFAPFFRKTADGATTARTVSGLALDLPEQNNISFGARLSCEARF